MPLQHRTDTVGSLRMHYVLDGSGPLVLLLHGFPEFWWSWRFQIAPLAAAGYRVVAPDLRGYNETERSGPYDLDTLSGDIASLIAHLGESRATIVGHDWGGAITWHLAAMRPDACQRAVVLNAPHPAVFAAVLRHSLGQLRRIYRGNAVDRSNFTDDDVRPFQQAITQPGAATAALGYYRAAFAGLLKNRRNIGRYPLITRPTLLIWAKDDQALDYQELVPPTRRWVSDLRIEPIEQCGHFVHQEQPEAVNARLLSFLQSA